MKVDIKQLIVGLVGGVIVGVLLRAILPVSIAFFASLVIFVFVANIILEKVEKDSALKRAGGKIMRLAVAILAFIGIRIMAEYLFCMPLVGVAVEAPHQEVMRAFMLEFFFLIPGGGLAYAIAYGKISRVFVYFLATGSFFLILWQVKQRDNYQARGARWQAGINRNTSQKNFESRVDNQLANNLWAITTYPASIYDLQFNGRGDVIGAIKAVKEGKDVKLEEDEVVRMANRSDVFYQGQAFTCVIEIKDGKEFNTIKSWVKAEDLIQLDPAKTKVKEGQYAIVRDKNSWTIYFLTDKAITVDDFPLGAYFIINGIANGITNEVPLLCPTREDLNRFCPIPLGQKIRLQDTRVGMVLRAIVGTKVTITFV